MNHLDYQFLEEHPDFDYLNATRPHKTFYNLEWNDMKDEIRYFIDPDMLSDPEFIKAMQSLFIGKVKDEKYSVLKNMVTGEYIFPMTPFRGNKSYARKKRKRMQPIFDSFRDKDMSIPVRGSRSSEKRLCYGIMITLTYTREYSEEKFTKQGFPIKRWSWFKAWGSITKLVNQLKMEISRIIGENGQASYGSCLVKEGCVDMYPAPHLIILFDKPVLAHRYGKQWLLGGERNDRSLVNSIQAAWERIAGSHCKINAITSAGGLAYAFKYVMKSIDLDISDLDKMTHEQAVCLNTHMNQSLHNQRDVISRSFLEKLDCVKEQSLLDYIRIELKQKKFELDRLTEEIESKGGFNDFTFFEFPELRRYKDVLKEYERLREEVYRVKMETSPWLYVSGGFALFNLA